MVALIRPKDWSQQPQGPVELDWSNPITPDFVFSGGSGGVLLGRKRYLVTGRGASDVFQASKYGLGYKPTRVTNSGLDFGAVQPITSDSWTVLTLANPTNAAVSTLFSQRNGSAPYNQIDLVANSNDSLAYRAGRFAGIANCIPSGARAAVSSSATLVDGVFHVFGASRTGVTSVVELHYDGVNVSSTQNGTGTSTLISAAQKTRIGNIGDYTADAAYTAECNIPLVFIYNRTLTAAEIAKVSADMLLGVHFWAKRPPSRLFIPAAATNLVVQEATHAHIADGVSLTTQWLLTIAEALHGHAADNITLGVTGTANLVVQEATHAHIADGVSLTTQWLLTIAEALHSHAADNLSLDASNATFLTIQDALHSHAADSLGFSLDTWLTIVDAAHTHTADAPTLSASVALLIAEALHAHYADVAVLSLPGETTLTPEDITAIAAAVLAAINATTIPVNMVETNGEAIIGNGTEGNKFRSHLVG